MKVRAFARASLVVVDVGFVREGHKYLLRQQLPVDYDFAVGHMDPRTRSHPVVPNYIGQPI
jgi:hypothetical protein